MTIPTFSSLQEAREALAKNEGALRAANSAFFDSLESRFDKLKASNAHPADFRRLHAEVRNWTLNYVEKPDWKESRDRPAYEGAVAWATIIGREIENRVTVGEIGGSIGQAHGSGGWFNAKTGEAIKLYRPEDSVASASGSSDRVGIGELLQGMFFGPTNEKVRNALSTGTDTAGGYTVPLEVSRDFIDRLRAKSVFVQAGAQTIMIDGKLRMVRLDGDPTATWRAENASVGDSDIVLSAVDFVPMSLSALVKVPYELLSDSVNIADILARALINALATELDRAALFGSGSSNEPTGLFNTPNINSVSMGTNGATPANYDDLLDMLYELELDNAEAPTARIWHPRTARTYRKFKDSTGQPLVAPQPLNDMQSLSTTSVPITQTQGTSTGVCSTVLMGNFAEAMLGLREQITILRLNETFAANGQIAFWARMRADVGFAHGQSFCKLIGVKP